MVYVFAKTSWGQSRLYEPVELQRPAAARGMTLALVTCAGASPIVLSPRTGRRRWVVKSKELERVFSAQHKAVEAEIKLANDSGKDGKPAVVLFQKTKTDFQKVWTYGKSAYPPSKLDLRIGSTAPQPKEAVRASTR